MSRLLTIVYLIYLFFFFFSWKNLYPLDLTTIIQVIWSEFYYLPFTFSCISSLEASYSYFCQVLYLQVLKIGIMLKAFIFHLLLWLQLDLETMYQVSTQTSLSCVYTVWIKLHFTLNWEILRENTLWSEK